MDMPGSDTAVYIQSGNSRALMKPIYEQRSQSFIEVLPSREGKKQEFESNQQM